MHEQDPAWMRGEVDALWRWAYSQGVGDEALLAHISAGFNAALAESLDGYARARRSPLAPDDEALRRGFSSDLGVRVRMATAAATDALFQRVCLMPEDCRDDRASGILTAAHLAELRDGGVVVVDWVLKPKEVVAIRKEADALDARGELVPHQGHNAGSGTAHRGDRISWVRGTGNTALASAVRLLQGLAAELETSAANFGPLHVPPEAMLACYPGKGTHYKPHRDSVGEDPRRVTCIFYLQTLAWRSEVDGGELRALPRGRAPQKVEPKGGRLVIFDSCAVEHEVLPARAPRMALTLWLRRRPPRVDEIPDTEAAGGSAAA